MAEEFDIFHVRCAICWEIYNDPVSLPCGHLYCKTCIEGVRNIMNVCPMCRSPIGRINKSDQRIKEIRTFMATHYAICHSCGKTKQVSKLHKHMRLCEEAAKYSDIKTSAGTKTIRCPMCREKIAPNGLLKRLKKRKRRGPSFICLKCALKKYG
ncbi:E3 ubiquitin-protein ligase RNF114-like [Centruroides vittatus]|uniref:E3 ubiquitin-protein ligase RNF114-like n=1 Tax=Centruroides vittatus TaxID=120091 RepID=UPI0035106CC8